MRARRGWADVVSNVAGRRRQSLLLFAASFLVYLVVAWCIDARAVPAGRFASRPAWAHAMTALTLVWLYAAWFAISWRPVFATGAGLVTFALLTVISNYKFRNVQEPLNFVDFALIPQIWRHPRLYQADYLRHPLFFAGITAVLGYIGFWCHFYEPAILPEGRLWTWAVPGGVFVAMLLAWSIAGPMPGLLTGSLHRRLVPADSARHVRDFGLAASLTAGLVGWRHAVAGSRPWPARAPALRRYTDEAAPVVVAVQSESFVDLRRAGLHDIRLPALEEARAHAVSHGRVAVPVQGAWTLRSEFTFLAGCPLATFGLDALHPYLRPGASPRTLAHYLRDAGFATTFIHPFDLDFFNRRTALPTLGFDRLLGEEDFAGTPRDGYFVPDMALAERALSMAGEEQRPFFCMIATMENHNPWDEARLPGIATPVERYIHHLRNADRMIGRLVDGLQRLGRPAVLAFYGDHVPTLPQLADPFPDPRTDYFVMGLRDGTWLPGGQRDCSLHELADMVLATLQSVCEPRSGVEAS